MVGFEIRSEGQGPHEVGPLTSGKEKEKVGMQGTQVGRSAVQYGVHK